MSADRDPAWCVGGSRRLDMSADSLHILSFVASSLSSVNPGLQWAVRETESERSPRSSRHCESDEEPRPGLGSGPCPAPLEVLRK